MVLLLKSCPRCKSGDMERTTEADLRCIQCGHYIYAFTARAYMATLRSVPYPQPTVSKLGKNYRL